MSEPLSQPLTQPVQSETSPDLVPVPTHVPMPASMSEGRSTTTNDVHHKVMSNARSGSHEMHHKISVDHGHYHPQLSTTSRGQLQEWIRAPIRGNLNEVPGIGPANIAHFGTICEQYRSMGGAELIDSTYQLIGKFLMLRSRGTSNVQNTQDFFLWLKAKGITSHANDIVEAVAEKVNVLIPGTYSLSDYTAK